VLYAPIGFKSCVYKINLGVVVNEDKYRMAKACCCMYCRRVRYDIVCNIGCYSIYLERGAPSKSCFVDMIAIG